MAESDSHSGRILLDKLQLKPYNKHIYDYNEAIVKHMHFSSKDECYNYLGKLPKPTDSFYEVKSAGFDLLVTLQNMVGSFQDVLYSEDRLQSVSEEIRYIYMINLLKSLKDLHDTDNRWHGSIHPTHILIDNQGNVRFINIGKEDCNKAGYENKYLQANELKDIQLNIFKRDILSIGVILFEIFFLQRPAKQADLPKEKIKEIITASLREADNNPMRKLMAALIEHTLLQGSAAISTASQLEILFVNERYIQDRLIKDLEEYQKKVEGSDIFGNQLMQAEIVHNMSIVSQDFFLNVFAEQEESLKKHATKLWSTVEFEPKEAALWISEKDPQADQVTIIKVKFLTFNCYNEGPEKKESINYIFGVVGHILNEFKNVSEVFIDFGKDGNLITDETVSALRTEMSPRLTQQLTKLFVDFNGCSEISDNTLKRFFGDTRQNFPNLEELGVKIFNNHNVTDKGLKAIDLFTKKLSALHIELISCGNINGKEVAELFYKKLTSLTSLTVSFERCSKLNQHLLSFAMSEIQEKCPNLKYCSLNLSKLTKKVLRSLTVLEPIFKLKKLSHLVLDLRKLKWVTDCIIFKLYKKAEFDKLELLQIDLSGCATTQGLRDTRQTLKIEEIEIKQDEPEFSIYVYKDDEIEKDDSDNDNK